MSTGRLHIDLSAIADNWRALASMSQGETGAVVKADGYGMGAGIVARTLAKAGCRRFFVAMAEEGGVSLETLIGFARNGFHAALVEEDVRARWLEELEQVVKSL